jgi:hypothetical protein
MLNLSIWWLGILLEALLLLRGVQARLVRKFPAFYTYVLIVFVSEFLRFSFYRWYPAIYFDVYWATQFLSLVIGSAVIFEIYRVGLRTYPGAARMARNLLFIVFGAIFAKALAHPPGNVFGWLAAGSEEIERNLRIVQALAILTLSLLLLLYAIPFGRNLRGILFGYGLFITTSIVQLTVMPYAWRTIQHFWSYLQPVTYMIVLVIWLNALWSKHPVPWMERVENDYEALLSATSSQLQRARARLGWVARG